MNKEYIYVLLILDILKELLFYKNLKIKLERVGGIRIDNLEAC